MKKRYITVSELLERLEIAFVNMFDDENLNKIAKYLDTTVDFLTGKCKNEAAELLSDDMKMLLELLPSAPLTKDEVDIKHETAEYLKKLKNEKGSF